VALGGALCWGLGSVYARHAPHPPQPLLAPAVEMLCAAVALTLLAAAGGEFGRIDLARDVGGSAVALAYLIVFGSIVAYSAYEWLLRNAPTRLAGTYALVNPVVAVALGWWLLDEPIGWRTVAATAVIVAGVSLIVRRSTGTAADAEPITASVQENSRSA
jgi:drug/metabolite transporter (DMT)-like permease